MSLKKCTKCNKNITKTKPGLVCSRCDKSVHADPVCVKLSNKQINTLKNSPGIEWSCEHCLQNLSRRSSFLIPDDSEDELQTGRDMQPIDTRKLVQDISRELKKTFREEIQGLEASLEFVTDQLSNMEQRVLKQNASIKELENKNQDLLNKNKNLELRVSVLEQVMNTFEQKSLSSSIEIAGLPNVPTIEVQKLIENIASKLDVDKNDVRLSSRLPGSKEKPGQILVEMRTPSARSQWIAASKGKSLTLGSLIPHVSQDKAADRVYIREALTKYIKTLLYTAKSQLNKSFKFVWCKDGKVCARKSENSKIFYIRSIQDINRIQVQSNDHSNQS